jgi:tRNA(Arg) A34 adenosine deaminase TadA
MTEPATVLDAADRDHLEQAIALSLDARKEGKHPFAALVVAADGTVLAHAGNNSLPPAGDPTQHAELRAAQLAARAAAPEVLAGATLYSSAEPCAMCAGAIYWCGIGRVVYALSEHRLLHLTGDHPENPTFSLPCREVFARGQRRVEVLGPAMEDEAATAHSGFWQRA